MKKSKKKKMSCCICFKYFNKDDPFSFDCGHTFCSKCIIKLKEEIKIYCPICRNEVFKISKNFELSSLIESKKSSLVKNRNNSRKDLKKFIDHYFKHPKLIEDIDHKLANQNIILDKRKSIIDDHEKVLTELIQKQQNLLTDIDEKISKLQKRENVLDKLIIQYNPLESKFLSYKNFDDLCSITKLKLNLRIIPLHRVEKNFFEIIKLNLQENKTNNFSSHFLILFKVQNYIFGLKLEYVDNKHCGDESSVFSLVNRFGTQEIFRSKQDKRLNFELNETTLKFDDQLIVYFIENQYQVEFKYSNNFVHSSKCLNNHFDKSKDDWTPNCDFLANKSKIIIDDFEIYAINPKN